MTNPIDPKADETKPELEPTGEQAANDVDASSKSSKELTDAQLNEVVGGLSPQPLPPGRRDTI